MPAHAITLETGFVMNKDSGSSWRIRTPRKCETAKKAYNLASKRPRFHDLRPSCLAWAAAMAAAIAGLILPTDRTAKNRLLVLSLITNDWRAPPVVSSALRHYKFQFDEERRRIFGPTRARRKREARNL